jgi:hypothetical protein
MAISSVTTEDYIDDAELKELRAEAENLVTRLYMSLGFIEKVASNGYHCGQVGQSPGVPPADGPLRHRLHRGQGKALVRVRWTLQKNRSGGFEISDCTSRCARRR